MDAFGILLLISAIIQVSALVILTAIAIALGRHGYDEEDNDA